MLYIASALTPTPILSAIKVEGLTAPNTTSLVVAKPDKIEIWDIEVEGLVHVTEMEIWGTLVGVDKVLIEGAKPHILILLAPPSAHLLLITFSPSPNPALTVTSSIPLTPPTPTLRQAEFFTSVIAHSRVALVSLWIGVLSCVEMEVEKDKDAKRRRASAAGMDVDEDGKRLLFKDNFNINIREHNLLHLTFSPSPVAQDPVVSFLWLSSTNDLQLQVRTLSLGAHTFNDLSRPVDIVSPVSRNVTLTDETDFNEIPFSCPAARRVLPITTGGEASFLVIGDEHTVLYTLGTTPQSPRAIRRLSATSGPTTSPRASARRSPQNEMVSNVSKRRKSSMGAKATPTWENERWDLKPVWRVRQGFGTVLAATLLDSRATGASALIGDECGRLTALGWEFEKNQGILEGATGQHGTVRVKKVEMGLASPASSLTYLDSAHVFLSSTCGDSSLLKLALPDSATATSPSASSEIRNIPARKGKGRAREEVDEGVWSVVMEQEGNEWRGTVDVKERWMNLAPVKDFCTVPEEGGGLSHLVVSSGASNTNSLRIVRSGVGLEEIISVEGVEGVERMWSMTDTSGNSRLLVSTASTTLLIHVDPEVSLVDIAQPIASIATLAAGLLPAADVLVQVTPSSIALWSDVLSGLSAGTVDVDKENEFVAAQVSGELVIAAKRRGEVLLVEATPNGLTPIASFNAPAEVSAVSIIRLPTLPAPILAIGTWTGEIFLYDPLQLQQGSTALTTLREPFYASSLHLKLSVSSTTSTSGVQLLAGLSDGTLITYDLEPSGTNGKIEVKARKTSSLGIRPLTICLANGPQVAGDEIVAIGLTERMSVIFNSKDRVDSSSVSRKDISAAATVKSSILGEALVLAGATGLSFVRVNSLKRLHVQTLDLGDRSVSRIVALSENTLADGATVRTMDPQNGEVLQSSFLEIRDATSLNPLAEMPMKEREEVTALAPVFLLGRSYLAVGTAVLPSDMDESYDDDESLVNVKEGRLLLLEVDVRAGAIEDPTADVTVKAELQTIGPVYDIATIHGFLAVAAGSKVSITRLDVSSSPGTLNELSSFSSAFLASHLTVSPKSALHPDDRLIVGDGMRSIIALSIDEGDGKIYDDQRDMATHSVIAMDRINDEGDGIIIADGHSNILTFRLKEGIESAATFGLREEVTRFAPGSLAPPSSAAEAIKPDLLFASRIGRIGVVGELTPSAAKVLDDLQRNLDRNSSYRGPGGIGWKSWRQGGTQIIKRDMAGFVDGDFVQKFLDTSIFSPDESEKILRGATAHETVSKLVTSAGTGIATTEHAARSDVVRTLEAVGSMH
ncbi:hypothetical protein I316_04642 [Kwoniella heveanensis BCC8398]|uniref:DNA damage-binding protein 1 n=1 Tax=Kwoniella heveanensis BCC8398 TaxID=1296120 RepID=A0A1B9GR71_9TREE|nr:hypothetical protein I316_04642 [Kwoniella heveanensis BCC8398]